MEQNNDIVRLRQPDAIDDPLTEVLRAGARQLLARAVELEAVMNHGRRLYYGVTSRMAGEACSQYVRTGKSFDATCRPSHRNPGGWALFGARFIDLLDRGSATLVASLLPIIRK